MIYLSASSIKDFISCEKKYEYRHTIEWEGQKTDALVIGSIVHEAIEKYWHNKDKALEYVNEQFKFYSLSSSSERKVNFCLDNFFFEFAHLLSDKDEIEKYFKIKYSRGVLLTGKIDRIIPGHIIFDWKTTKWPPNSVANDVQFILYHDAYEKIYGVKPSALFYMSLTTGKMVKYEENLGFKNSLYNEVIPAMLETINNNRFAHTGLFGYKICDNCVFKDYCYKRLEEE